MLPVSTLSRLRLISDCNGLLGRSGSSSVTTRDMRRDTFESDAMVRVWKRRSMRCDTQRLNHSCLIGCTRYLEKKKIRENFWMSARHFPSRRYALFVDGAEKRHHRALNQDWVGFGGLTPHVGSDISIDCPIQRALTPSSNRLSVIPLLSDSCLFSISHDHVRSRLVSNSWQG